MIPEGNPMPWPQFCFSLFYVIEHLCVDSCILFCSFVVFVLLRPWPRLTCVVIALKWTTLQTIADYHFTVAINKQYSLRHIVYLCFASFLFNCDVSAVRPWPRLTCLLSAIWQLDRLKRSSNLGGNHLSNTTCLTRAHLYYAFSYACPAPPLLPSIS